MHNLYVGNLPYDLSIEELQSLFEEYGPVKAARIALDKVTGKSRGFGFVEMETEEAKKSAFQNLSRANVKGRNIVVADALKEKQ